MAKILIVEDDNALAETIKCWLVRELHIVEHVDDGNEAAFRMRCYQFDAIILDWELPGASGLEVCRKFRQNGGTTPIIMLTGRSSIADKEGSLDCGADDYLTKPFELRELGARIRAILRRGVVAHQNTLVIGNVTLHIKDRRVFVGEQEVRLVPKEYALLQFLMRHHGEIFSADALLERVWSSESDSTSHTVHTCIYSLRKKLEKLDCNIISTIYGVGYQLKAY